MEGFSEKWRKGTWPIINDINGARQAIWLGVTATLFIAFVNIAIGVLHFGGLLFTEYNSETVIGMMILGIFSIPAAIGIKKGYRFAAILISGWWVFEVFNKIQTGNGLAMAFFILIYLFNGVRGTFAYHKLIKKGANASSVAT